MILHIFLKDKFTVDYIERINRLFDKQEHFFVVHGVNNFFDTKVLEKYENVVYFESILLAKEKMKVYIDKASKVLLHSLFLSTREMFFLYNNIDRKKELIWGIWGGDLYDIYRNNRSLKKKIRLKPVINELCRIIFIKRVNTFIGECDYEQLTKWYTVSSDAQVKFATYTYNFIDVNGLHHQSDNDLVNVMVGHSATRNCCHINTFKMLEKYKGQIKVLCPLSYPKDMIYINQVIEVGINIFGDNFIPITEYMDYNAYVNFLSKIDIGIFNNDRQQGMGNITNLLYLGKKVYISDDNTINKIYKKNEYKIFSSSDIKNDDFLLPLSAEDADYNNSKVQYLFSDENFKYLWSDIFK